MVLGYHAERAERPYLQRTVVPQSDHAVPVNIEDFAVFLEEPCPPNTGTARSALWLQFLNMATDLAIRWTDREMMQRTIVTRFDAYGMGRTAHGGLVRMERNVAAWLDLPRVATDAITSVEVYDENGNAETLDPADYSTDVASEPHRLRLDNPPAAPTLADFAGLRVTYDAGYASADDVPGALKLGVQQIAAYMYERRGMDISHAVSASGAATTLSPYRVRTGL